ncbi:hypothetical protein CH260_02400 [Rhodococcus sp. 05-2256-B2]|uniref:hypothetical protein n=1 Tax=unclassified Rhodococcus (in: high G+C Gram-positive bacteria) TaxID=192944 RepID=UPI000B9B0E11|nr:MULTISPECIES: hypothetical protein [unclassified Rhodococcus (in: high G+C Gram-positive bacteria)]OZD78679.1 hypothetical protein CH258_21930 [Rhodococcus sp. 05-2256-B4]OZD93780.1 hypothetical protein CH257_09805 [Rhodococcus sp. 05-2256-B3]OZE00879.1 hypothetical protein CH260_02400 [Rhodococcus sp. 05-2256-B2]OZE04483.1 hypothetical protein CH285_08560 [Rhodococcus sp. 05-2256-B1]
MKSRWSAVSSLGAVLVLLALVLAGCTHSGIAGESVETVDRQDPAAVVRGWVDAVNAGESSTGESLVADEGWQGMQGWFDAPRAHLDNLEIVRVTEEDPTPGTAAEGYRFEAWVSVRFDLTGGDGSMHEGATTWGYILARQESSDPWSIVSNGM